jgi:hypothetical protein
MLANPLFYTPSPSNPHRRPKTRCFQRSAVYSSPVYQTPLFPVSGFRFPAPSKRRMYVHAPKQLCVMYHVGLSPRPVVYVRCTANSRSTSLASSQCGVLSMARVCSDARVSAAVCWPLGRISAGTGEVCMCMCMCIYGGIPRLMGARACVCACRLCVLGIQSHAAHPLHIKSPLTILPAPSPTHT